LDLSNKTDFYVHYSIDNHGGLYPPEVCAKMANHSPPDFSRTAENQSQNFCRMAPTKNWGHLDEEQERPAKKLSHHGMNRSTVCIYVCMYLSESESSFNWMAKHHNWQRRSSDLQIYVQDKI